jgi:lysophospholipase L1-like esterase
MTTPVPRWKKLVQNLGLSAGTFILCAGALELILRLCGYGNLEIYEPHPGVYWRLKPNQDCYTKVNHQKVHINSLGTRGPEFEPAKPAGTFRILSLGDSRTFGWGLSETETYSAQLQELLRSRPGNSNRIEVINAGVNGWSFPQMLVYFRDIGRQYQPDLVILGEANLWTQFSENNSPEFVRKFMTRVRLKNLLRRSAIYHYVVEVKLKKFYEDHRARFIPVDPKNDAFFREQQKADPDALFRDAVREFCRVAATNHIQPVLLFFPRLDELEGTNVVPPLRVKRQVSQESGVPLVDLTSKLPADPKALYLEADPVHFNASGNEWIARHVFEAITNIAR